MAGALARHGIAKAHVNAEDGYQYRSIDDVYNRLAPLLALHKLCILPRVLERTATDRHGIGGDLLVAVALRAAFDLVSAEDGSVHTVVAYGEALDGGDKGTAKAMAAAYKVALFQTFCVPIVGSEDADARSHRLKRDPGVPEPVQGWEQWADDIAEMLRVCQSREAIERVQNSHRVLLAGLRRERPELYAGLGEALGAARAKLAPAPARQAAAKHVQAAPTPTAKKNAKKAQVAPTPTADRHTNKAQRAPASAAHQARAAPTAAADEARDAPTPPRRKRSVRPLNGGSHA